MVDVAQGIADGGEKYFVEVQRCQIQKRRNLKEYLPENCQKDYDRRMRKEVKR